MSMAQEFALEDILVTDMLMLDSEKEANLVLDKLWQVGVETEIEEGFYILSGEKKVGYYIELQDVTILDIEVKNEQGEYERVFDKKLRKKLIKVELKF